MKKVITYGTFDLLHYGHIRLLERAKALGDYLIVGVTSDDFDRARGKINVQQSLTERIAAVKETGLADLIIVEEYEGQKIDDIQRYGADIFAVGSDWKGHFDYLNEYCKVVYLERTPGVSSSQIRTKENDIKLGIISDLPDYINKFHNESAFVNGIEITGLCTNNMDSFNAEIKALPIVTRDYKKLINNVDAVYINYNITQNFELIRYALESGKSVLCESPIDINESRCAQLFQLAEEHHCVLMESIRTAYSTAYSRLLLLLKSGKIGSIVSVDATCTSLKYEYRMKSMYDWGGNALLPVFQILGTKYQSIHIISKFEDENQDMFTKINFIYNNAVASITVAEGAKSEGNLVITGTKGYIYVPSPWWKTDYFEVRYEDQTNNQRYYYQLDGEGIRYMLVSFCRAINTKSRYNYNHIDKEVSLAISKVMEEFTNRKDMTKIQ